ncbi:MAG: NAD(P)/FAD-dependent oxidoreductase [Clostridia bacterium]|nr:NAD(P)/FAD-dependent oxidoreductase [Clostridia bacterium]
MGDIEVYQPKSFGTYEINGTRVTIWNDPDRLEQELLQIAPEDAKRIKRFVKDIKLSATMTMPTKVPMEMMSAKDGMKLLLSMRKLFTCCMSPDYTLMSLVVSLASIASGDGGVPKYVSRSMAQRMADRYCEMGGKLLLGQEVDQILVKDNRACGIKLANGEEIVADYVIPACDMHFTIETLLRNRYHIEEYENRYKDYRTYPVPTSVLVGIGVEADLSEYPDTFSWECKEIKVGNTQINRIAYKNYAYEKTFAPEGCTTITTAFLQYDEDYLVWKELYQNQEAYKKEKDRIGQFVKEEIERVHPELQGKLRVLDVATPVTYERYCNAYHGAWMSFILKPGQKRLTFNGIIPELSNCYLAGQWMISPGGLPGAVNSGKSAVQRICKAEGMPLM